jgi:hypothetical protein
MEKGRTEEVKEREEAPHRRPLSRAHTNYLFPS